MTIREDFKDFHRLVRRGHVRSESVEKIRIGDISVGTKNQQQLLKRLGSKAALLRVELYGIREIAKIHSFNLLFGTYCGFLSICGLTGKEKTKEIGVTAGTRQIICKTTEKKFDQ